MNLNPVIHGDEVLLYMERCQDNLYVYLQRKAIEIEASRSKATRSGTMSLSGFDYGSDEIESARLSRRRQEQVDVIVGGARQDEQLLWNWILQIASALVWCHYGVVHLHQQDILLDSIQEPQQRILHRDLKPDNSKIWTSLQHV
jgi:serine/threonine protein kinase